MTPFALKQPSEQPGALKSNILVPHTHQCSHRQTHPPKGKENKASPPLHPPELSVETAEVILVWLWNMLFFHLLDFAPVDLAWIFFFLFLFPSGTLDCGGWDGVGERNRGQRGRPKVPGSPLRFVIGDPQCRIHDPTGRLSGLAPEGFVPIGPGGPGGPGQDGSGLASMRERERD